MSLPTYVHRRRIAKPEDYIQQALNAPPQVVHRFLQALKAWQNDFEGYYINPTKRAVRPFWLLPKDSDDQLFTLAAAGAAGDAKKLVPFVVDTTGHFEIAFAMFQATSSNFLVEIFDGGNNNAGLQNEEIHAQAIAGTARRPFIWPESYFLNTQNAARTLFMNFRNLSTAPNSIRWAWHGRRWYHKDAPPVVQDAIRRKFERMEKTYTYFLTLNRLRESTPEGANPPAVTLSAGQALIENQAPVFEATNEADTEAHKVTVFSTGPFEFQLREEMSGRTLSNGFVQVTSGMGDGEFPFIYPETFLIERNYRVLFEVRDLSGAENRIYPVLTGRRLQYA